MSKVKPYIFIFISAMLYSIGLHYFVNPANIYPAGFIGISKLVTNIFEIFFNIHLNFMILYLILQVCGTILVYKYVGHRFALLTVIQFSTVFLMGVLIPNHMIVDDPLMMVIFGGALSGIAILMALKAGACTGGTDFVAIYVQNKRPHVPIWDYVMYFNWFLLLIAGLLSGIETALYSMVYQFITMTVISNMDARHKLNGLYIITDRSEDVTDALFQNFHRGITKIWGEGAYTKQPKTLLFMVVNSFEVNHIIHIVHQVDEKAFINVTKSERVVGNFKRKEIN